MLEGLHSVIPIPLIGGAHAGNLPGVVLVKKDIRKRARGFGHGEVGFARAQPQHVRLNYLIVAGVNRLAWLVSAIGVAEENIHRLRPRTLAIRCLNDGNIVDSVAIKVG